MKKYLNLICSVIALFCFVSMYMPIIAPRYPAQEYYAPSGSFEADYFYSDDYYCAREYWSITRFTFASNSVLGRIALSVNQALLLLWAWMSVRGEAGKKGLAIALFNLAVIGVALFCMTRVMWSCRWGVVIMLALDAVAAVIMAASVKN